MADPPTAPLTQAPPLMTAEQVAAENEAMRERADKKPGTAGVSPRAAALGRLQEGHRKDGIMLWCRQETPVGSRREQQRCPIIEALLDPQQNGQKSTDPGARRRQPRPEEPVSAREPPCDP